MFTLLLCINAAEVCHAVDEGLFTQGPALITTNVYPWDACLEELMQEIRTRGSQSGERQSYCQTGKSCVFCAGSDVAETAH